MSKKKIVIIDYRLSNLFSVKNACKFVGSSAEITSDRKELMEADAAILPGVGAYADAMDNLDKLELIVPIKEFIGSGRKFMGVCLGLQLLFSKSSEFGNHNGLDIIKGKVVKFSNKSANNVKIRVPNIGWNRICKVRQKKDDWKQSPLRSVKNNEYMYFVHSYYVVPEDKEIVLAKTDYEGISYCSAILKDNLFAVQFHPEKSGLEGLKIYNNWIKNL